MKLFERTVKCPICNAVIKDTSMDESVTCEACGLVSSESTSISLTNISVKDSDKSEKFDLVVSYAVLQKVFHTAKNKVEFGKQVLRSRIESTYLVTS